MEFTLFLFRKYMKYLCKENIDHFQAQWRNSKTMYLYRSLGVVLLFLELANSFQMVRSNKDVKIQFEKTFKNLFLLDVYTVY